MPKRQFPAVHKQWLLFSVASSSACVLCCVHSGYFSVTSSSACFFSLSRRLLPASFLCRVILCLLLFSVASSSASFASSSARLSSCPLSPRRVVLLLVASSCSSSRRPLLALCRVALCLILPVLRSWILRVGISNCKYM